MMDTIEAGQEASESFYNQWVEEVKAHVPKDRLLVFSVKEGWEPLCKFLGEFFCNLFSDCFVKLKFYLLFVLSKVGN